MITVSAQLKLEIHQSYTLSIQLKDTGLEISGEADKPAPTEIGDRSSQYRLDSTWMSI